MNELMHHTERQREDFSPEEDREQMLHQLRSLSEFDETSLSEYLDGGGVNQFAQANGGNVVTLANFNTRSHSNPRTRLTEPPLQPDNTEEESMLSSDSSFDF